MNPPVFRASIMSSFQRLNDLDLTDWGKFPNQKNLPNNSEFSGAALSSIRYEEVFKKGLELSQYNFMLSDYSYFQFSQFGKQNQTLRYAYYPNPFEQAQSFDEFEKSVISEQEVFGIGELYAQYMDDANMELRIPPIRYDYDQESYIACKHPAGHLHIGFSSGGRFAVKRILTPLSFSLIIAKYFYSDDWEKLETEKDENGFTNAYDKLLAASKNQCQNVDNAFFSEIDEALHFFD